MFKISNKKWCTIDSESNGSYSHHDPKNFLTKSIESSLCDYSDAYILVKGDIAVTRTIAALQVIILFKENNHLLQPHK